MKPNSLVEGALTLMCIVAIVVVIIWAIEFLAGLFSMDWW